MNDHWLTRERFTTSSAKKRYDLATKLGNGQWISQGSYDSEEAAKARAEQWLERAGSSGIARITDEIGQEIWRSEQ